MLPAGLVSSIGHTIERLKSTKASGQELSDDNNSVFGEPEPTAPKTDTSADRRPTMTLRHEPVLLRPSLPRRAKSEAKRGRMAGKTSSIVSYA